MTTRLAGTYRSADLRVAGMDGLMFMILVTCGTICFFKNHVNRILQGGFDQNKNIHSGVNT
jgi:hypothetical protein